MQRSGPRRFGRRTVLQTLGTSLVAASITGTAMGQSDSASVEFVDQESDGQSVVIRALEIPVDGDLLIMTGDTIYRTSSWMQGLRSLIAGLSCLNPSKSRP